MRVLAATRSVGFVAGTGTRVRYVNDAFLRLAGREPQEVGDVLPWHRFTELTPEGTPARIVARLDGSREASLTADLVRPDGRRVPVFIVVATAQPRPRRWVAMIMAIGSRDGLGSGSTTSELHDYGEGPPSDALPPGPQPYRLTTIDPARFDSGGEQMRSELLFSLPMRGDATSQIVSDKHDAAMVQLGRDATTRNRDTPVARAADQPSILVPGVDLARRYVSTTGDPHLAGGWCDAGRMPDGRLFMCVGDVAGRGPADGLQARMTSAVRSYVNDGHGPAGVLAHLDSAICNGPSPTLATAVVVALDEDNGDVEYASAGHPYPLLRSASGDIRQLREAQGPALGIGHRGRYRSHTIAIQPDTALVLYTKGLVERRDEPLYRGLGRLATALRGGMGTATAAGLVDRAFETCWVSARGRPGGDDACVLAFRRTGAPTAPLTVHPKTMIRCGAGSVVPSPSSSSGILT